MTSSRPATVASVRRMAAMIFTALALSGPAMSQTPPPDAPYAVTYIEVAPNRAAAALELLRAYRTSAAKSSDVVRFQTLQRIAAANHFAIVEGWKTSSARAAYAQSAAARSFRSALEPLLIAGYDERLHVALTVGPPSKSTPSATYAVTHVDIVPTRKDEGVALTKKLGDDSRGTTGNLAFDVLTQANRPNHMTILEAWKSRAAQTAHTATPATIAYRKALHPMSGALYDERLYVAVK